MKATYRQGIIAGQRDINSTPLFLHLNTTNGVDITVSPDPLVLNFSHGRSNYQVEFRQSVNNAWTGLTNGAQTYWLYWDISLKDATVTQGVSIYSPVYQTTAPQNPAVGQHWFDTNNAIMQVWDGARWVIRVRLFAASVTGTAISYMPFASQAGLNVENDTGYIMKDRDGFPIRNSDGTFFTTDTQATAANSSTSSGIKFDQNVMVAAASEPIPKYALVKYTAANIIGLAGDETDPIQPVGIVDRALAPNETGSVIFRGAISHTNWSQVTVEAVPQFPSEAIGKQLYAAQTGKMTWHRTSDLYAIKIGTILNATTIYLDIDTDTQPAPTDIQGVVSVTGALPIMVTNNAANPIISINQATTTASGFMAAADKVELNQLRTDLTSEVAARAAADGLRVLKDGDSMTGFLSLASDPVDPMHAVTKQYVDQLNTSIDTHLLRVWFVGNSGTVQQDGSLSKPFHTITDAYASAAAGDVIIVTPGTYAESLVINKDINIRGFDEDVAGNTIIAGKLTHLSGYLNTSHLRLTNDIDVALEVNGGGAGRFVSTLITRTNGTEAVRYIGTGNSTHVYDASSVDGTVQLAQTGPRTIVFVGLSENTNFMLNGVQFLSLEDCPGVGDITHFSGRLNLRNVGFVNSLVSTADASSKITMDGVSFLRGNGTYGQFQVGPNSHYTLKDVLYDVNIPLAGTRDAWGQFASELHTNYTPVNYVVTAPDTKSHVMGIDTALGTKEPSGTAAAIISAHNGAPDPHPQYAKDQDLLSYVAKAGDTMTGQLVLAGDPTSNLEAATKQYVDATAVSLLSGTQLDTPSNVTPKLKFDISSNLGYTYDSFNQVAQVNVPFMQVVDVNTIGNPVPVQGNVATLNFSGTGYSATYDSGTKSFNIQLIATPQPSLWQATNTNVTSLILPHHVVTQGSITATWAEDVDLNKILTLDVGPYYYPAGVQGDAIRGIYPGAGITSSLDSNGVLSFDVGPYYVVASTSQGAIRSFTFGDGMSTSMDANGLLTVDAGATLYSAPGTSAGLIRGVIAGTNVTTNIDVDGIVTIDATGGSATLRPMALHSETATQVSTTGITNVVLDPTDNANGNVFEIDLSQNVMMDVVPAFASSVPNEAIKWTLIITQSNGDNHTIMWGSQIYFQNTTAPTLSTTGATIMEMITASTGETYCLGVFGNFGRLF